MKSLFFSYNTKVEKAYIIRVKGKKNSEDQALKCAATCNQVKMPFQFWDAYNGISDEIVTPDHHNAVMNIFSWMCLIVSCEDCCIVILMIPLDKKALY